MPELIHLLCELYAMCARTISAVWAVWRGRFTHASDNWMRGNPGKALLGALFATIAMWLVIAVCCNALVPDFERSGCADLIAKAISSSILVGATIYFVKETYEGGIEIVNTRVMRGYALIEGGLPWWCNIFRGK